MFCAFLHVAFLLWTFSLVYSTNYFGFFYCNLYVDLRVITIPLYPYLLDSLLLLFDNVDELIVIFFIAWWRFFSLNQVKLK